MEHEQLVANDGYKLPYHKEAGWKDSTQMKGDPDAVVVSTVPVPLAGGGAVGEAGSGGPTNAEERQTCEGKAEHRTSKDDDWGGMLGWG